MMSSKFLALSKPVFLGLAFIAIFSAAQKSARADPVTYSTSGTFSGSGTSSVTFNNGAGNSLTLAYTAVGPVTVISPTTASFGDIKTTVAGSGAPIPSMATLTINVFQTSPGSGMNAFVGTLTGTISQNSASMNSQIVFTVTSFSINGVAYTIDPSYHLVPPSTNNGVTSLQGTITGPISVPEPATLFLFATGLTGAAGLGRKWLRGR